MSKTIRKPKWAIGDSIPTILQWIENSTRWGVSRFRGNKKEFKKYFLDKKSENSWGKKFSRRQERVKQNSTLKKAVADNNLDEVEIYKIPDCWLD